MKKIVLSLAGVLAATAFAPEASALPAFARQTGLACSSCHFQHFPVLSTTGQEFKNGAYTQLSAKGKFKGEDLSIPDTLNAAILLKAQYVKTNGTAPVTEISGQSTDTGQWRIPDELSLFFGGRIAENSMMKIGFMTENNMATGGPAGGMIGGLRLPVVIGLDPVNVMVIPFLTGDLGQAYGYELSSQGMNRGIRWAEHHAETSAARYTNLGTGAASGIAYVVSSDMGYINLTRWAPSFGYVTDITANSRGMQMSSSWLRVAATPTIADWAMHIALGVASGSNYCGEKLGQSPAVAATAADKCDTKGNVFDVQAQGAIAEMETSFYFMTAKAPKTEVGGTTNHFNAQNYDLKATTIGAEVSVIPHTLHLGAAFRKAKEANAAGSKDDAITVTAIYDLFQNVAVHMNYSKYSGPKYDVPGTATSKLTFMLESAW